jgi:hypothetical protein
MFSGGIINAQVATNTESKDSTNIYYQAFKAYCNQNGNTETLMVEENNLTTKSLPTSFNEQEIRLVNAIELQSLLKKSKQIHLIRIVPLRVRDGEFFVNIIVFKVDGKRSKYNFVNEVGMSVVYEYREELKTFIFKEIR